MKLGTSFALATALTALAFSPAEAKEKYVVREDRETK
jgi:hypothetical protein